MQSTILKEVTQRRFPQYNWNHMGFKNFNVYTLLFMRFTRIYVISYN